MAQNFGAKIWRESIAVGRRILTELVHRKRSLIFWAVFPVAILILNGLIVAERAQLAVAIAFEQTAPTTLVGAALFFSCLGGSVATLVAEREQQTLKRLFISPLSGVSYFLGIFLAHATIGLGQGILVYTVAAFWGADFTGSVGLAIAIILLSIISYVGLGFLLGTQLARRTEDVNALVAAFGVPLLILGGAFLPASFFPETLLNLAQFNPIYHMTEALSGATVGEAEWEELSEHLAFLSSFAIAMAILGWLSYRRMLSVERRL